ncbi:MAG TPA: HEAT repeat domain-containing protein, partial [Anaerolineae bacterium]
ILLFGLSRLIGRVGLGNANLIFPTGIALICGALIFQPGLPSAGLAYFGQKAFRAAFRGPIDSLLYNAVSLRVKGRARAFIGGLIVPVGSAIGGGLLLLRPFVPVPWFLSALIGLLALAYFGGALVISKQYARALIRMLEQEDFSFLISQEASDLAVTDPATLNELRKRLEESPSPEFTLFMAQLISQIGGSEAVPILHEAAKNAANAQNRAAIIDVLAAADISGEAVRQFYVDYLADPNPHVRRSAIAGLARLAITKDEQFVQLALEMLTDQDFDVRIHVLSLLAEIENLSELHLANEVLNQLLADPDPHRRTQGIQILGQVVQQQVADQQADSQNPIYKLTAYLADPDDQVRLETAITIEKLSQISLPEAVAEFILTKIRASEHDPVERVRQAALKIMGELGPREFYQDLMAGLADSSQSVRETAMDVLVQIGKPIIPLAHPLLDSTNPQMRKMAAIVLSQISPKQFGGLIESQVAGNLLAIYRNCGYIDALSSYHEYSSIATAQNVLQEQNEQLQAEIFFLLGTIHNQASVDVIVDSLRNPDTRVRANAIEALESLTSPQTAQLIGPLFDPNQTTNQLLRLSQDTWDMQQPDAATTIKQIIANSETFWPRAILIYALGELGLSLSSGQTNSDNGESEQNQDSLITNPDTTQSKKRRIRSIDLMSLLSDGDQEPSAEPEPTREMPAKPVPLTLAEIETLLEVAAVDTTAEVRSAVSTARRMLAGVDIVEEAKKEKILLSTVEKIIFLKQVPFFKGMTVYQLDVLAKICEEEFFNEDQWVFNQGDPGGILYVIVTGSVGIEQEKRKGSFARLATLGPYHYFGEMSLLDNGPRSAAALAVQDTLTLRLRREPLIALARQYPDVSLELIQVLSERLRQANNRIADLTRARPRELQKLFDQLD